MFVTCDIDGVAAFKRPYHKIREIVTPLGFIFPGMASWLESGELPRLLHNAEFSTRGGI